jgi:outer membrane protein OmpA-like peptidoglycan-associated protein
VLSSSSLKVFILFASIQMVGLGTLYGQNLVSNWSFEQYKACPGTFTQSPAEFTVPGWQAGGLGSPDHFHYCSRGEAGVPYNWAGVAEAYEGDGYAGLYLWMADGSNYREYLFSKLAEPMIKDSTYYIEFHYKLASYANYCIDRIALLLTTETKGVSHDKVIEQSPTLAIVRDSALTRTTGIWEAARFEYKAAGNERSLIIGNFSSDNDTKYYKIRSRPVSEPMLSSAAYYYIDGIVVVPKFRIREQLATKIIPAFTAEQATLNTAYVLNNLQFESNSAKLNSASFQELDNLSAYLLKNLKTKIEVSGHTDDVGDDQYNLDLSRKRAQAVADYLVAKRIDLSRIKSYGFGESQPLLQGNSEDARKLNRRVEVKFLE